MPTVHLQQNGAAADPTPAAARDEAEQAHDEEQIEQIRSVTALAWAAARTSAADASLCCRSGATRTLRLSVSSVLLPRPPVPSGCAPLTGPTAEPRLLLCQLLLA
jgi:hypothetical protein